MTTEAQTNIIDQTSNQIQTFLTYKGVSYRHYENNSINTQYFIITDNTNARSVFNELKQSYGSPDSSQVAGNTGVFVWKWENVEFHLLAENGSLIQVGVTVR